MRTTYGSRIEVQINFLLMRQTCNPEALRRAWEFAERFDTEFRVDLIHRALPYFTEGPNRMLQFTAEDRPQLELLTQSLLALRQLHPDRYKEPSASIRAIPDWLLRGAGMRVPCNAHDLIWVGADGSVQLCYAAFPLGNLYTSRLKDVLRTPAHVRAAQQAFRLECPNCCCKRESRIRTHWPSLMRYL
ncbi:MAG: hypothetical protein NTY38_26620 [Acidobacteria bacterium]|nr:hypothetical protein [Acidobacteriota bacterium]